jgi:hypothetical protein
MANIRSPERAICELRLPGRGSGSARLLPVPYAREGGDIVILPTGAAGGAWWRHFIEPHPVEIRLNGAWRAGIGRTVPPTHPGRPAAQRTYRTRFPGAQPAKTEPFVVITLLPLGMNG